MKRTKFLDTYNKIMKHSLVTESIDEDNLIEIIEKVVKKCFHTFSMNLDSDDDGNQLVIFDIGEPYQLIATIYNSELQLGLYNIDTEDVEIESNMLNLEDEKLEINMQRQMKIIQREFDKPIEEYEE